MKKPLFLRVLPPTPISQSLLDAASHTIDLDNISAVVIPGAADVDSPDSEIPVVLLHGTLDSAGSWSGLAEVLHERGRTVILPSYGNRGTAPVRQSLRDIQQLITYCMARNPDPCACTQVDIVGHSQGGLLAYLLVQNMLLATDRGALPTGSIRRVISVAGSIKGAQWPHPFHRLGYRAAGLASVFVGPAASDQLQLAQRISTGHQELALAQLSAEDLPEWVNIVSAGDGLVLPASSLTEQDYPGVRTLFTEDELGRSVLHWFQQRDPDIIALIVRELEHSH